MLEKIKTKAQDAKDYIKEHPLETITASSVILTAVAITTRPSKTTEEKSNDDSKVRYSMFYVDDDDVKIPLHVFDDLKKDASKMFVMDVPDRGMFTLHYGSEN